MPSKTTTAITIAQPTERQLRNAWKAVTEHRSTTWIEDLRSDRLLAVTAVCAAHMEHRRDEDVRIADVKRSARLLIAIRDLSAWQVRDWKGVKADDPDYADRDEFIARWTAINSITREFTTRSLRICAGDIPPAAKPAAKAPAKSKAKRDPNRLRNGRKLRNFHSMGDEKLAALVKATRGTKDTEARKALLAEARSRRTATATA